VFICNSHVSYGNALEPVDAEALGVEAAAEVQRFLSHCKDHAVTPLHSLPTLAKELGVGTIHIKDEGFRLGLGSFKALGGSYAVIRLTLEEAARVLGRKITIAELQNFEVRAVAARMTVTCATDGNHGRSVAKGAQLVGARAAIFVHSGVSEERVKAIQRYGADLIRVEGNYDDAVAKTSRVAEEKGWVVVSDTSWPGYERIPRLIMQGYTAMISEALQQHPRIPTHVFVQAGVGGVAAAAAGYLSVLLGDRRPTFVVVEPLRAACIYETAKAGHPVKVVQGEPTVMAMLECYEPSLVAWRILSHVADAFMTVDEEDATAVMNRLARPAGNDPAIVAGESGAAGLAGLVRAATDPVVRDQLSLDSTSEILVINTEGATDPKRYAELVGLCPGDVIAAATEKVSKESNSPFIHRRGPPA
jgi:diaminopropionate ammonia-lyase